MAWANGLIDLAMPYMIQTMRDYVGRVDILMQERKDSREDKKVRAPCIMPRNDAAVVLVLTFAYGADCCGMPRRAGHAGWHLPNSAVSQDVGCGP